MRRCRDRGVTVVEAAFALPILCTFIFGLVDLGMWSFNDNKATNAAKDGARAAIIDYRQADVPGSGDHDRIVAAIEDRLDRQIAPGDITVSCVQEDGDPVAGGCAAAVVDTDRVRVTIDWTWDLVTPVATLLGIDEGAAEGVATMTILGAPVSTAPTVPTTSPPPSTPPTTEAPPAPIDCVITNIKVGPSSGANGNIRVKSNGQLRDPIWVSFDTNGVERCTGLTVQVITPGGTIRSAICDDCEIENDHDWGYADTNEKIWTAGTGTTRIFNEYVDQSATFTLV